MGLRVAIGSLEASHQMAGQARPGLLVRRDDFEGALPTEGSLKPVPLQVILRFPRYNGW